jgi:hypothetical protein
LVDGRGERLGLGFDDGQWVAVAIVAVEAALVAIAIVAIVALPVVTELTLAVIAILSLPIIPGPIIPGPIIPRPVVSRPIVSGPIVSGPVVSGPVVSGPIIPRPVVSGAVVSWAVVPVAVAIAVAVVTIAVPLPVVVGPVFAGSLVPLVARSALVAALLAPLAAVGILFGGVGLGGFWFSTSLVLEVDVEAGRKGVATHDVARRPLWLHRAQHTEVVLGVLLVALGQHAVASGQGVARQLLVLLEHVLGGAPDLDAVGPIRLERSVGVVLWLATAAAAASIAAALPLHPFEISHVVQQSGRRTGRYPGLVGGLCRIGVVARG